MKSIDHIRTSDRQDYRYAISRCCNKLDRLRNFIQYNYLINLRELVRSRIANSLALY